MTTRWQVPRMWDGKTVAILASGPSLTQALAESVRDLPRIAVKRAWKMAPDADMLIGLDGPADAMFWEESREFAGPRICGTESDEIDALYPGLMYERVKLGEGHEIEIRQNALAAIRIAEWAGAAKIVLLGFDPARYEAIHAHTGFFGFVEGLEQITAELRAKGIEVERIDAGEDSDASIARRNRRPITTKWQVPKLWPGETVAVIAGGPSVNQALADSVRRHKRIVVNHAYLLAPDADMLIMLDSGPSGWDREEVKAFAGLKLCGGAFDIPGVHYIGQRFETITLGPANTIEVRNSGLTALRIAAQAGAAKILLLGFDPETHGHFEGYPGHPQLPGPEPYPGMTLGLAQIIAELRAQGLEVERIE